MWVFRLFNNNSRLVLHSANFILNRHQKAINLNLSTWLRKKTLLPLRMARTSSRLTAAPHTVAVTKAHQTCSQASRTVWLRSKTAFPSLSKEACCTETRRRLLMSWPVPRRDSSRRVSASRVVPCFRMTYRRRGPRSAPSRRSSRRSAHGANSTTV